MLSRISGFVCIHDPYFLQRAGEWTMHFSIRCGWFLLYFMKWLCSVISVSIVLNDPLVEFRFLRALSRSWWSCSSKHCNRFPGLQGGFYCLCLLPFGPEICFILMPLQRVATTCYLVNPCKLFAGVSYMPRYLSSCFVQWIQSRTWKFLQKVHH